MGEVVFRTAAVAMVVAAAAVAQASVAIAYISRWPHALWFFSST